MTGLFDPEDFWGRGTHFWGKEKNKQNPNTYFYLMHQQMNQKVTAWPRWFWKKNLSIIPPIQKKNCDCEKQLNRVTLFKRLNDLF